MFDRSRHIVKNIDKYQLNHTNKQGRTFTPKLPFILKPRASVLSKCTFDRYLLYCSVLLYIRGFHRETSRVRHCHSHQTERWIIDNHSNRFGNIVVLLEFRRTVLASGGSTVRCNTRTPPRRHGPGDTAIPHRETGLMMSCYRSYESRPLHDPWEGSNPEVTANHRTNRQDKSLEDRSSPDGNRKRIADPQIAYNIIPNSSYSLRIFD